MRRKKFSKILISVVCLLFICGSSVLSGCGGTIRRASEVSRRDYFKQNTLRIKTKVRNLYKARPDNCYFDSDLSLSGFKDLVNAMSDQNTIYEAQIFKEVLLIKMMSVKTSYFALKRLSDSEKRFALSNMPASVSRYGESYVSSVIIFPYHLCQGLEDRIQYDLSYSFNDGDEVEIDAAYDGLKAFYAALGRPEYVFDDNNRTIDDGRVILTVSEVIKNGDENTDGGAKSLLKFTIK